MLETLITYLIFKPAITFAGKLLTKASESAMDKLGEQIMTYLLQKYPKFEQQLQTAKQSPAQANKTELAQKLAIKAEDDTELTRLISSLKQQLEVSGAKIDNRKIVHGNDYSGNFTSGRDINFGDNIGGNKSNQTLISGATIARNMNVGTASYREKNK